MRYVKGIAFITIPTLVLVAVILEVLFRTIIPASQVPQACFDGVWNIYKFCPGQGSGVSTKGKLAHSASTWRINNAGWNSPIDYQSKGERDRIAVIGDSYVEAFQVDIAESYPYLLSNALGADYEVYSFGISGAPLSQYLNLSRYVVSEFDPDVLIFNVVHNDFEESIRKYNSNDVEWLLLDLDDKFEVEEVQASPNYSHAQYSPVKKYLRHSALIRYLFYNLRIKDLLRGRERGIYIANVDVARFNQRKQEIIRTLSYVVETIRAENPERRVIFVVDAVRQQIYSGNAETSGLEWLHTEFRNIAARNGVEYLDLTEPMNSDFALTGRMFNSPDDGHWNGYGHSVVCSEIFKVLFERRANCL